MSGRLAIDFGTSNTVIAVWDEVQEEGIPLHIPGYGRFLKQDDERISLIPSLIHYGSGGQHSIGNQVLQRNLYHAKQTFRWMKRYITNRSPIKMRVDDRQISYEEAGKAFLGRILKVAGQKLKIADEEIALTVPVEAFEHYENWLTEVTSMAGMPRFRLIDEPSAAALGYGLSIQPGDSYLIFDFGGGTLDVAVVLIEEEQEIQSSGRYCRVLGKAGLDIGGVIIDQWLFQEVLEQNQRRDTDEDVMEISNALLVECERAKERLSFYERADISVVNPETGAALSAELTRPRFEEILEQHEAFRQINWTIRRALNAAHERGYREQQIKAVLMVGGSSQIPAVQRTLQRMFGRDKVKLNRPLDAVARGAAVFVAGMGFYDYIQHDYAVRFGVQGKYKYHTIVEHGTAYPTSKALARLSVKAASQGQTQLGLAIFEISRERPKSVSQAIELVFDPSGAARMIQLTPEQEERRHHFWMNEGNPTFLTANPPAAQGEKRFKVEFSIDGNKRLLITVHDLKTGRLTHQNYPVVKLT